MEITVLCPECSLRQTYHSHNKKVEGKRRKECNKCGTSFNVKDQMAKDFDLKEKYDKPDGFFKYEESH